MPLEGNPHTRPHQSPDGQRIDQERGCFCKGMFGAYPPNLVLIEVMTSSIIKNLTGCDVIYVKP